MSGFTSPLRVPKNDFPQHTPEPNKCLIFPVFGVPCFPFGKLLLDKCLLCFFSNLFAVFLNVCVFFFLRFFFCSYISILFCFSSFVFFFAYLFIFVFSAFFSHFSRLVLTARSRQKEEIQGLQVCACAAKQRSPPTTRTSRSRLHNPLLWCGQRAGPHRGGMLVLCPPDALPLKNVTFHFVLQSSALTLRTWTVSLVVSQVSH